MMSILQQLFVGTFKLIQEIHRSYFRAPKQKLFASEKVILSWPNLSLMFWFIEEHSLLCISTLFKVFAAPESWSKYFFQPFSTVFVHFKSSSVISHIFLLVSYLRLSQRTESSRGGLDRFFMWHFSCLHF